MLVDEYLFHAVGQQLFRVCTGALAAHHDALHIVAHLGGQLPGLADELIDHRMNGAVFLLGIDQNVPPLLLVERLGHLLEPDGPLGTGLDADGAHPALLICGDAVLLHPERPKGAFFNALPAQITAGHVKFQKFHPAPPQKYLAAASMSKS